MLSALAACVLGTIAAEAAVAGAEGPVVVARRGEPAQLRLAWRARVNVPGGHFIVYSVERGTPGRVEVARVPAAHSGLYELLDAPVPGGSALSYELRFSPRSGSEQVLGIFRFSLRFIDPLSPALAAFQDLGNAALSEEPLPAAPSRTRSGSPDADPSPAGGSREPETPPPRGAAA